MAELEERVAALELEAEERTRWCTQLEEEVARLATVLGAVGTVARLARPQR